MAKIASPNFGQMKFILSEVRELDQSLKQIQDLDQVQIEELKRRLKSLRFAQAKKELESIPVERLSDVDKNIRVSVLRGAGIENIGQIFRYANFELERISGIGEDNRRRIRQAADSFIAGMARVNTVRLHADAPGQEELDVIQSLYMRIHLAGPVQEAKRLYADTHASLEQCLSAILVKGSLHWFLASRSKKESTVRGYDLLNKLLEDGYRDRCKRLREELVTVSAAQEKTILEDYQKNAAAYYAALEKADTGFQIATGDLTFPRQLADEVRGEALDTSLLREETTLRAYQEFGARYILHQKKAFLGDEMGLGKTLQAIAAMASLESGLEREIEASALPEDDHRRNQGHFLVVCPAGLLINWEREIRRYSSLSPLVIHGRSRDEAGRVWIEEGGVAVSNYETTDELWEMLPDQFSIDLMAVDEAHYVKNSKAKRSIYTRKLTELTDRLIFMTGTPLENNVYEFCSLLLWLNPQLGHEAQKYSYMCDAPAFREMIAPVYLRRKREDVLRELPDLIEEDDWCPMSKEDKDAYREILMDPKESFPGLRRVGWQTRQADQSAKGIRLLEICRAAAEEGRKVLVFSFFLDTLSKVQKLLGDQCLPLITGSVNAETRQNIIDRFCDARPGSVLACQIQAGGTGLNIQAASVIIFCEPQIKPSLQEQAIGRAYRMGQVRNVLVRHLLCEGTVDERIRDLLERKRDIFENYADSSVMGEENRRGDHQPIIQDIIEEERRAHGVGAQEDEEEHQGTMEQEAEDCGDPM